MARQSMWFAFTLHGEPSGPGGYVREVEVVNDVVVVNDGVPDGEKIIRYVDGGRCAVVGGPHCSGRLFATEAEGWAFCAQQLREQAARFDQAAAKCAAKAAIEVVA